MAGLAVVGGLAGTCSRPVGAAVAGLGGGVAVQGGCVAGLTVVGELPMERS
ncbi:MAG TPA: hypothetical protein VFI65_22495 [Streptosporangiaceae bacterium]|nr:hypothetical protein [Streptosporangiaceae bacterium]